MNNIHLLDVLCVLVNTVDRFFVVMVFVFTKVKTQAFTMKIYIFCLSLVYDPKIQ